MEEYLNKELFEKAKEEAEKIGEERRAFWKMLETFIPQLEYSIPEKPKILDLGCGVCYEGLVLSAYFGGKPYGYNSENVLIVGIDIDKKEIERAKREYERLDTKTMKWVPMPNFKFICGDARNLKELINADQDLKELVSDGFDIVVVRHPNIAENSQIWEDILRKAYDLMKQDGLLIATSYIDFEHRMLESLLMKIGYEILINKENPYSIPTKYKEVIRDNYVLFAKKKVE